MQFLKTQSQVCLHYTRLKVIGFITKKTRIKNTFGNYMTRKANIGNLIK